MTMQWSDERLDAALRELLTTRVEEIGAIALPVDEVSARLADQLGVSATGRRSGRRTWRNSFMSNTLKFALAGAAALLVAVMGIGLYFNQPGGVGPPAPSPSPSPSPTAVEIAEAYISARNAYDPEQARQLVADNFTTTEPPDGFLGATNFELAFASHAAWGFQVAPRDDGCQQRPDLGPELAVVACDYLWTTHVHRVSGQPPTPVRFTFNISEDRIRRVLHDASSAFFFGTGSFYDGFLAEHIEFRELVDMSFSLEPEATREVIELLPEYFELYEEWLSQQ